MTTNNVFGGPDWYKAMKKFELKLWRSMDKPDNFCGYVVQQYNGKTTFLSYAKVHESILWWHYDVNEYNYNRWEKITVSFTCVRGNHVHYNKYL